MGWQPTTRQCEWMTRALLLGVIVLLSASWWVRPLVNFALSLSLVALLIERSWRRKAVARDIVEMLTERYSLVNGHWYEWTRPRERSS